MHLIGFDRAHQSPERSAGWMGTGEFLNPRQLSLIQSRTAPKVACGTYCVGKPAVSTRRVFPWERSSMSLSSAKNYALRAERSQDAKEAADLLAKAILELVASIEATDAKVKKINKSG